MDKTEPNNSERRSEDEFKIVGEKTLPKSLPEGVDFFEFLKESAREALSAAGMESGAIDEAVDTLAHITDKPPSKEVKSLVAIGMALSESKHILASIDGLYESLATLVGRGHMDLEIKNRFAEHSNILLDDLLAINSAVANATLAIERGIMDDKKEE